MRLLALLIVVAPSHAIAVLAPVVPIAPDTCATFRTLTERPTLDVATTEKILASGFDERACGVEQAARLPRLEEAGIPTVRVDALVTRWLGEIRERHPGDADESSLPAVRALLKFHNRKCAADRFHASALFVCEYHPFVHGIVPKKFDGNDWYKLNGPEFVNLHVMVPEIECAESAMPRKTMCREAYEAAAKRRDALEDPKMKELQVAMGDCRSDADCIAIANGCGSKTLFEHSSRAHKRHECECKRSAFVSGCFPKEKVRSPETYRNE